MSDPISKVEIKAKTTLSGLYKTYWRDLCSYIRAQFGSGPPDPEDVAQQVFEKFSHLDESTEVKSPKAFLIRMAHNIVLSEKRHAVVCNKYTETARQDYSQEQGYDLSPERVFIGEEQFSMVKDIIAQMPQKRRQMLLMNRIHGLSYVEIARRFGISDAAVKKHVYKAVGELDAALKERN